MIIIGEKLSGFISKVGQAIAARDAKYIQDLAIKQSRAGANFIDICPAVEEDAHVVMQWMVDVVQTCCDTPLSIDSADADLLIATMQHCNVPGIINSASLVANKADKIFPVIANTDWSCICLLDHDSGIPENLQDSLDIFEELLAKAKQYNIAPQRLFFDPLIDTLTTNNDALLNFASICMEIKKRCPQAHITSGLSNVSIGLPARKIINTSFLTLAMQAGMDSAIIDPLDRKLVGAVYATQALLGKDEKCEKYKQAYIDNLFEPIS